MRRRYQVQTRLANHFADLITGRPPCRFSDAPRSWWLRLTKDASRTETMKTLRLAFWRRRAGTARHPLGGWSRSASASGWSHQLDPTTALFILILAPEASSVRAVGVHFPSADGTAAAEAAFGIIEKSEHSQVGGPSRPAIWPASDQFDQVGVRYPDRASLEDLGTIRPGECCWSGVPAAASRRP